MTSKAAGSDAVTVFERSAQRNRAVAQRIMRAAAGFIEPEIDQGGGEVEDRGEGGLLFRDPGDGFDADRVQSEDESGQPCAGDRQAAYDEDDQAGGGGMEEDVHQVVAQDGIAPEAMLKPESAVKERVILLGRTQIEPDTPQAAEGAHGGGGDVAALSSHTKPPWRAGQ